MPVFYFACVHGICASVQLTRCVSVLLLPASSVDPLCPWPDSLIDGHSFAQALLHHWLRQWHGELTSANISELYSTLSAAVSRKQGVLPLPQVR